LTKLHESLYVGTFFETQYILVCNFVRLMSASDVLLSAAGPATLFDVCYVVLTRLFSVD